MFEDLPKSKKEAKELNIKQYFTGVPCKNGHLDKRYANTGICYSCKNKNMSKDYSRNTNRIIQTNKKSYAKHKEKRIESSNNWVRNNRARSNQIKANYRIKHYEKCSEYSRNYMREKRKDPFFKLCRNISKALWAWLNGLKSFRHWEEIVKYSAEDLIAHLEVKFRDGMTWKNYGPYWHVDHIKPLSLCTNLDEAWALSNLQPLLSQENLSKGDTYPNKFSEALESNLDDKQTS
jgi:5-methylcytosine-specific restriction endonuclease McrA